MLAAAGFVRTPGIDMGVFLVRNNAFIRGLFAELAKRAIGLPVPTKVIIWRPVGGTPPSPTTHAVHRLLARLR